MADSNTNSTRIRPEVVKRLVGTGTWGEETAKAGERADYRCEYCDLDLMKDPESYKLWQVDHIVPKSKGGDQNAENTAIACKTCNWDWKGQWDPSGGEKGILREVLISRVREYIATQRGKTEGERGAACEIIFGARSRPPVKPPTNTPRAVG